MPKRYHLQFLHSLISAVLITLLTSLVYTKEQVGGWLFPFYISETYGFPFKHITLKDGVFQLHESMISLLLNVIFWGFFSLILIMVYRKIAPFLVKK